MKDGDCGSLVPVFDMINHANDPNCDWTIEGGVRIWADREIPAGQGKGFLSLSFYSKVRKLQILIKNCLSATEIMEMTDWFNFMDFRYHEQMM